MADVVDHPLGDQEVGQLGQRPGRKRQVENGRSWSTGRDSAACLIARRFAEVKVKVGGRPPA
jgi:hypothetical protein